MCVFVLLLKKTTRVRNYKNVFIDKQNWFVNVTMLKFAAALNNNNFMYLQKNCNLFIVYIHVIFKLVTHIKHPGVNKRVTQNLYISVTGF